MGPAAQDRDDKIRPHCSGNFRDTFGPLPATMLTQGRVRAPETDDTGLIMLEFALSHSADIREHGPSCPRSPAGGVRARAMTSEARRGTGLCIALTRFSFPRKAIDEILRFPPSAQYPMPPAVTSSGYSWTQCPDKGTRETEARQLSTLRSSLETGRVPECCARARIQSHTALHRRHCRLQFAQASKGRDGDYRRTFVIRPPQMISTH